MSTPQTEANKDGQSTGLALATGSGVQRTTATWTVELNCKCPHCKEWVNLLHYEDFWDAHHGSLEIAEHGTERSKGIEVTCPDCGKDFEIDCEY